MAQKHPFFGQTEKTKKWIVLKPQNTCVLTPVWGPEQALSERLNLPFFLFFKKHFFYRQILTFFFQKKWKIIFVNFEPNGLKIVLRGFKQNRGPRYFLLSLILKNKFFMRSSKFRPSKKTSFFEVWHNWPVKTSCNLTNRFFYPKTCLGTIFVAFGYKKKNYLAGFSWQYKMALPENLFFSCKFFFSYRIYFFPL